MKATPERPAEAPSKPRPGTCLASYSFDSHGSVLDEQRERAGAKRWNDFAERYAAKVIDPAVDHPVERVAELRVDEAPLLWFTADYAEAVVDAAVFGDLQVVDATRLRAGERVEIGSLNQAALGKLDARKLAEFLMRAGVIQTFVHIGATLCLISENSQRVEFTGEHEYYTNTENHDPLDFALELAADGRITVVGLAQNSSR